jgi:hypothetical protein
VRPLLQEGADLTPCGFRFLQLSDFGSGIHPLIIARFLSMRISCGIGNHFLDMDTEWAYALKQAFRSPGRPTKLADRHPATPSATVNLS